MARRIGNKSKNWAAAMAATAILLAAEAEARSNEAIASPRPGDQALSLFAAQMTDNNWHQIVRLDDVRFRDAYLVGAAWSRRFAHIDDRAEFDIEGQIVRHFGDQDHWEFNAAVVGRWMKFPWNRWLPTHAAFGIGPSYATREPAEEADRSGSSARFLLYWMGELEFSRPNQPWSVIARLHHRSTGYGVFADSGGSNFLALGVRHRF
jgi:hypothetical protein